MPKKTVQVEASLKDNFKIETKAGRHLMIIDQPSTGGGKDEGPSPLDYFLMSLAGCIATISRIVAKQKRIDLKGVDIKIEGDVDTDFLMGQTEEGRAGFTGIKAYVNIDAPLSKEEKEAFLREVDKRCPISDNTINTSDVSFIVES